MTSWPPPEGAWADAPPPRPEPPSEAPPALPPLLSQPLPRGAAPPPLAAAQPAWTEAPSAWGESPYGPQSGPGQPPPAYGPPGPAPAAGYAAPPGYGTPPGPPAQFQTQPRFGSEAADRRSAAAYVSTPRALPRGDPGPGRSWHGIGPLNAYFRAFKQYAMFGGTASRGEFWWFNLASLLIGLAFAGVYGALGGAELAQFSVGNAGRLTVEAMKGTISGPVAVVAIIQGAYGVAALIPGLALVWRRLHDTGRTGLWFLASFVPILGLVVIVFLAQASSMASAQYQRGGFGVRF